MYCVNSWFKNHAVESIYNDGKLARCNSLCWMSCKFRPGGHRPDAWVLSLSILSVSSCAVMIIGAKCVVWREKRGRRCGVARVECSDLSQRHERWPGRPRQNIGHLCATCVCVRPKSHQGSLHPHTPANIFLQKFFFWKYLHFLYFRKGFSWLL